MEMDYANLAIDKKNDRVSYNDGTHTYWTNDSLKKCISVTTLVHMFTTFDEEFWSAYKAIERLLGEEFNVVKPVLLDTKKFNKDLLETFNISEEGFNNTVKGILKEWEEKREKSCIRGTKIHREYELQTLGNDYSGLKTFGDFDFSGYTVNDNNIIEEGNYVLPELLLSRISDDGVLRIAGQADLVVINGKEVTIIDFKTNRKIDTKSYFDKKKRKSQKMLYPLNNLDDSNFWHYTIQMSIYGWIIEKNNPNLKVKSLLLLHHDHDDNKTVYECEYRPKDVERLLMFYKKRVLHEEYKNNNKTCRWEK